MFDMTPGFILVMLGVVITIAIPSLWPKPKKKKPKPLPPVVMVAAMHKARSITNNRLQKRKGDGDG